MNEKKKYGGTRPENDMNELSAHELISNCAGNTEGLEETEEKKRVWEPAAHDDWLINESKQWPLLAVTAEHREDET